MILSMTKIKHLPSFSDYKHWKYVRRNIRAMKTQKYKNVRRQWNMCTTMKHVCDDETCVRWWKCVRRWNTCAMMKICAMMNICAMMKICATMKHVCDDEKLNVRWWNTSSSTQYFFIVARYSFHRRSSNFQKNNATTMKFWDNGDDEILYTSLWVFSSSHDIFFIVTAISDMAFRISGTNGLIASRTISRVRM